MSLKHGKNVFYPRYCSTCDVTLSSEGAFNSHRKYGRWRGGRRKGREGEELARGGLEGGSGEREREEGVNEGSMGKLCSILAIVQLVTSLCPVKGRSTLIESKKLSNYLYINSVRTKVSSIFLGP